MPARRTAFTAWVAVLAVLVGIVFVGVTALTLATWLADPAYEESNPVVDLAFFALGGVLVGGGLLSQLRAPERHIAGLQQAMLGLLALALGGLLGNRVEPTWGGLLLLGAVAVAAALHPARPELLRFDAHASIPLAALAAVAAVPAALYAQRMLAEAREAGPSCFLGQCVRGDRLAEVAALAAAVVLVTLLASARTPGWRIAAMSAAAAAVLVGLASVVLPHASGSLGLGGGTLAVLWGVVTALVAEWELRHRAVAPAPEGRGIT